MSSRTRTRIRGMPRPLGQGPSTPPSTNLSTAAGKEQCVGKALLLMDIQHGTTGRYGATAEYFDRVVATQVKAEDAGIPVILVRVGFSPGYPEVSERNKSFAAVKKAGNLLLGESSTEVEPRLLRGNGEVLVTKKRISAFAGSDLLEVLRARDV